MGRAIVRQPKLFLFDEPLSNLDALLRSEMRTEIKKLHQRIGATTIYVTHDQVEAMTLAERIVVLSGGHIMQVGTPDEIYNQPVSKFVAGFTGSPPMNFLQGVIAREGDATSVRLNDGTLLSLPPNRRAGGVEGQHVELGIRPEDVRADATAGAIGINAKVVVVEPLGAETLVTFACSGGEMVSRMPPGISFSPGDVTGIFLDMGKSHLFDRASGAVI